MPLIQSFQKSGYGMFSGAVSPYLTLTFVGSIDAATSSTLTHPGSVQVGDVCLLLQYGYDNDSEDFTSANTPSGFTHIVSTPNTGTIQTSMNVSFARLTSTAAVAITQPGMDNYGHIAMYYRISDGTLQGTATFPGTSNVVSNSGPVLSTIPASAGNTAYISFVTTSSYNEEALPFAIGLGSNSITQYGNISPGFGSFTTAVSYGPQPQISAEAQGFSTVATYVGVASGRIGFTKSGV